jgi:hypothetical protein
MNLENMHKVLKHTYFGGKKVKRMDKAIIVLMKFIRDKLFDRLIVLLGTNYFGRQSQLTDIKL